MTFIARLIPRFTAALLLCAGATRAADVRLAAEPVISTEGPTVTIRFALTGPGDVEVAVLDGQGRVVRHLAAGRVGQPKAAAPLKPDSLEQTLVWDRTDDLGNPVLGSLDSSLDTSTPSTTPSTLCTGLKFRVRVGMRAEFGRLIGGDPCVVGTPVGLATDPGGRVHLMSQSYRVGIGKSAGPRYLQVFSPAGKYDRTLMPYPAGLEPGAVIGFGLISSNAPLVPRNYEGVWPQIYSHGGAMVLLPTVSDSGNVSLHADDLLFTLDRRGALLGQPEGLPFWPPDKPRFSYNRAGPTFAALSPDGRRLYIAGPYVDDKKADAKMKEAWPAGRVYVLDTTQRGGARPFVTLTWEKNMDEELPSAMKTVRRGPHGPVHGLAVDRKGQVYVCDRANDRIAIFDDAGGLTGSLPVRQPHQVGVNLESGEICVLSVRPVAYQKFDTRLLLFPSASARKPSAEMALPDGVGDPLMALDIGSRKTRVWLTNVQAAEVWRVERKGHTLEVTGRLPVSTDASLWGADRISVDPDTDDLYINEGWSDFFKYSGLTGEGRLIGDARALRGVWERDTNPRSNFTATDSAVGPDGFIYLRNGPHYSGPITRWTRSLLPMPVADTGTHIFTHYIYSRFGAGYAERGFDVHPDGRLFVASMYDWNAYFIHFFTPEGRPVESGRLAGKVKAYGDKIQSGLVGPLTAGCGGLEVDGAGHTYVGMRLFPDGFKAPPGFDKDPAYSRLAGSIFKFQPAGGGLVDAKSVTPGAPSITGIRAGARLAEGALTAYPDYGIFSGGLGSGCVCRNAHFDLDGFGRLYIPNALRYSVAVVDNAGNEILRYGQYGNPDDKGAGQIIPLGWPLSTAVSHKHVYVSDMLNKRVVRADIRYAVTRELTIPDATAGPTTGAPADWIAPLCGPDAAAAAAALAGFQSAGEKAFPALQEAWQKDGANTRRLLWAAAAVRVAQLRADLGPGQALAADADFMRAVHGELMRQSALPTADQAWIKLCNMTRILGDKAAPAIAALAEKCRAHSAAPVRLAALWAADRPDVEALAPTALKLARAALKDDNERVRTLGATLLFERNNSEGLGHILVSLNSQDEWVLDLARPCAREEVVIENGPSRLRHPVGPAEVETTLGLLTNAYNNTRWVAAGILMFSGDPRAPAALARQLGQEKISFVRNRLMLAVLRLRAREATQPLLEDVSHGAGDRKKGTGWKAAEHLADIGDPDAVGPMIEMLNVKEATELVVFALSRCFDGSVTTSSEYRLIPDPDGRLQKVSVHALPPVADIRQAWERFWKKSRDTYKWTPDRHPLRGDALPAENKTEE